jgi:hypothetical protein
MNDHSLYDPENPPFGCLPYLRRHVILIPDALETPKTGFNRPEGAIFCFWLGEQQKKNSPDTKICSK